MTNWKSLTSIFSICFILTGCVNSPCWDVNVRGRLPEVGDGSARGQICLPPTAPQEEK